MSSVDTTCAKTSICLKNLRSTKNSVGCSQTPDDVILPKISKVQNSKTKHSNMLTNTNITCSDEEHKRPQSATTQQDKISKLVPKLTVLQKNSETNKWTFKLMLQASIARMKNKISNIFQKLLNKTKLINKTINSANIATETNCNKIAIILDNSSEDLLTQYIKSIHALKKEAVKFALSKNKISNEQSFLRLKKQGIKLVAVCSDKLAKKSVRGLLKFNTRWGRYLNKNGLIYVHSDNILKNNLIKAGVITDTVPNEEEVRDIALGVYTLKSLSNSKSGQSIIVQAGSVLGIETEAETTTDFIERCVELKNTKKGGILFETTKVYRQNTLDFPVINMDIIKTIHNAKLSGIAVNAEYCRIENMQKVIKFANRKKIFIIGI